VDETEAHVDRLLRHLGYSDIAYEPDGNVPPGFLIDRKIAVEVRRLNQNFESDGIVQGLEEIAVPIWQTVKRLAMSLGPPTKGVSWFIGVSFRRPLPPSKRLRTEILAALVDFQSGRKEGPVELFDGQIELEFFRASKAHTTFFVMGSQIDDDSGGWIMGEMSKNIRICIDQKSKKVTEFKFKYENWWLVLVDLISGGLDESDRCELRRDFVGQKGWQKILIVNALDHRDAFDLLEPC